jgi:hypothetical protein
MAFSWILPFLLLFRTGFALASLGRRSGKCLGFLVFLGVILLKRAGLWWWWSPPKLHNANAITLA